MKSAHKLAAIACVLLWATCARAYGYGAALKVPQLSDAVGDLSPHSELWKNAAFVTLSEDYACRRPAAEKTSVAVAQEQETLDVFFRVTQHEPVVATQSTNGPGVLQDDHVSVYLYPQGTAGFEYSFSANARGTRYQTSSENTAYAPEWSAWGEKISDGYVVVMRIPFAVIRSGDSKTWSAQFLRATISTGSVSVWTYSDAELSPVDPAFAGTLQNVRAYSGEAKTWPKGRLQVYGLGIAGPSAYGGSSARAGLDLSLPVTRTASFVAALHPDFSNVEMDQQTIAPTAFSRQVSEVRPFFTQTGGFFNQSLLCGSCPATLYSPAIPAFDQGYALEGTQGPFSFAGFDTLGSRREDRAAAVNFTDQSQGRTIEANLQQVDVSTSAGFDATGSLDLGYLDQADRFGVFASAAHERGTFVTSPSEGGFAEFGGGYVSPTASAMLTFERIGTLFSPVDGYVAQSGISGYQATYQKSITLAPSGEIHDLSLSADYGRYHDPSGATNQSDAGAQLDLDLRGQWSVHLFTNSQGVLTYDGAFLPFASNGFYVGYRDSTAEPSYVEYSGGAYYQGALRAWSYVGTLPLRPGLNLSLEADNDSYASASTHTQASQWLERGGLDWQIGSRAEFGVGVRRIFGVPLPNAYAPPNWTAQNDVNATAAFHLLRAQNEFYLVYGDPAALSTNPAIYFKWTRYIGAQKGT